MHVKQKGGTLLTIFAQPRVSHFQIFVSEVSNSNQVCLRAHVSCP